MREIFELKDKFLPISDWFSAKLEIDILSRDINNSQLNSPPILVHNIFLKFSYDTPVQEGQISEFEEKLNSSLEGLKILGIVCDKVLPIRYEPETGLFLGVYKRDNRTIINKHHIPDQTIYLKEPFYELDSIDKFITYEHRTSPFEKNRAPSRTGIKRSSSVNQF
tara:strand:- start:487 stop:981 length:495 start_codon:yes stop_codon:yes gene_type:complete